MLADRRKYVWTYQFTTTPAEATEIEFYQTTMTSSTVDWEYRLELEHGLSPRIDIAFYQIFAQKEKDSFKWDAFQIRARYKLTEPGEFFLNPLLYVEYNRKIDLERQNKIETKLILARNFGRVNLAVNPVYEFFWAPGDPVHEVGLDVGLSYELSYRFSFGLEAITRTEIIPDARDKNSAYLGPTVSLATSRMFYTVGVAFGLNDSSDDARIRFIMGVEL